jgi:hypothetical protein
MLPAIPANFGNELALLPAGGIMSSTYRAGYVILATIWSLGAQVATQAQDANRDVIVAKTDVSDIVQRLAKRTGEFLAKRTGEFKEEFDKAVEHSMMEGTKLEERAKHRSDDLHNSARRLRDVFGDKRDKNNPAVRDQVDKTLAASADVNRIMQDHRFTDKLQRNWELLRSDLNGLAAVYDLSPL